MTSELLEKGALSVAASPLDRPVGMSFRECLDHYLMQEALSTVGDTIHSLVQMILSHIEKTTECEPESHPGSNVPPCF